MDFGLDNEFESDDSFFDDPRFPKKPKAAEKKSIEDIFGFEDDKKTEKSGQSSLENIHHSPAAKPKVRFNVEETRSIDNPDQNPSKSSLSSKGLDWLGSSDDLDIPKKDALGTKIVQKSDILDDIFSSVPSKTPDAKKSFDLLDDILPQRGQKLDQKKTSSFEDILKESKAQRSGPSSLDKSSLGGGFDRGDIIKSGPGSFENSLKDSGRQRPGTGHLEDSLKDGRGQKSQTAPAGGLNIALEPKGPAASRRSRRTSSTGVTDVLGLFGSGPSSGEFVGGTKVDSSEERKGRSGEKKHDIPDWLGGSSTTTNKSDTTIASKKIHNNDDEAITSQQETKNVRVSTPSKRIEPTEDSNYDKEAEDYRQNAPQTIQRASQNPSATVDNFQTSMSNLQTQESFLLVSLQLKKYEANLTDIKKQQEEILRKQDNQFDRFLNTYIEKQKHIEHDMLSQQERINEHIRMLAIQNMDGFQRYSHQGRNTNSLSVDNDDTVEEKYDNNESDFKKDKNNVMDKILEGLKQRHNEEYFLMEESYKKQISLLEKSSEQLEHRLNQDMDSISKTYEEKLQNIKLQHSEEMKYWVEKMKNIEENHKQEIEQIKHNHARVLGEMKEEFLDQVERFKERTNRETDILAGSGDISQKINFSLDKLEKSEQILENLQEKVINDYNILSVARERSIENKEKDVIAMRDALENCRAQAEKDRSQLLALIRTLEQKLSEQTQNSQEERWALQQAAATIAARSAAFDREVDFSRTSIERERDQMKTLKETLLAEQEKITMQLTEEKLKLSAEKSRLEVSAKLYNNYEVEKIKTEAETAIQVAKELTDKLNQERNFVQRQKIELENYRSKLVEKERDLMEREEYIEEMKRTMQQKVNEDRRVIQEAKFLENRYLEKLSELQSQAMALSNREKKIAEDKLSVSKERLALYTSVKLQSAAGHKKCVLCKAEEEKLVKSDLLFLGHSAVDPEFMRLRIEATEDERNSEVSREDISPKIMYSES